MGWRSKVALLVVAPWFVAAIPKDPPAPIELSAAEVKQAAGREVVIRVEASDQGGAVTGVVDVKAKSDKVIDAIIDCKARMAEIGAISAVDYYDQTPAAFGVKWTLKVLLSTVVFHVKYTVDRPRGWVRYLLDSTKTNDIVATEGAYQVYAHGEGSRIVFRTMSDSGRSLPEWIKRWLAVDSLTDQLAGIRGRAEKTP